jgi:putative ABC transport system permease protein
MAGYTTEWLRLLLRFAWDSLASQRGRSALTMLGMAIGTASVVAVVSIGLVGREYVIGLIEGVGSNLVFAYGTGDGINPEEVSFADVEVLAERVRGAAAIAPVLETAQTLSVRGQPRVLTVLGVTPSYARVRNIVVESGLFLSERDDATADKVCLVSVELAQDLFAGDPPADAALRLFDLRFRVIGVFREGVESAAAVQRSEVSRLTAVIPFSTFRNVAGERDIDVVYLQAESAERVPEVVAQVREVLASRHRSLESFKVESLHRYLELAERVSGALTLVLIAIAGVSLLVGGIGIMNIMLVTVSERTRDIAVRLALGARRRDILLQFLAEAGILSVTGGVLGVLIGVGGPAWAGLLYEMPVPISGASVLVAFGVSVSVGLFFGLYPARKAAAMNIVDALVHE